MLMYIGFNLSKATYWRNDGHFG